MQTTSITSQAHDAIRAHVAAGDVAIDATAGNGHDTLFLAELVGPEGQVVAFDTQPTALQQASARCNAFTDRIIWVQACHSTMNQAVPASARGNITAILFNLGYLPGGNKRITTRCETSLVALQQALSLLAVGGILSIVVYPGHAEGAKEAIALRSWLDRLPAESYRTRLVASDTHSTVAPFLVTIVRNLPGDAG